MLPDLTHAGHNDWIEVWEKWLLIIFRAISWEYKYIFRRPDGFARGRSNSNFRAMSSFFFLQWNALECWFVAASQLYLVLCVTPADAPVPHHPCWHQRQDPAEYLTQEEVNCTAMLCSADKNSQPTPDNPRLLHPVADSLRWLVSDSTSSLCPTCRARCVYGHTRDVCFTLL